MRSPRACSPFSAALALIGDGGSDTASDSPREPSQAYRREIDAWRARRLERLRAEDGWLTLVGLFWLEPGKNAVGSDAGNRVVLPAGKAPAFVGSLDRNGRHGHLSRRARRRRIFRREARHDPGSCDRTRTRSRRVLDARLDLLLRDPAGRTPGSAGQGQREPGPQELPRHRQLSRSTRSGGSRRASSPTTRRSRLRSPTSWEPCRLGELSGRARLRDRGKDLSAGPGPRAGRDRLSS